jgi:hypothetical protein
MTRISRGVAQRYAASAARRKRRPPVRPNFSLPAAAPGDVAPTTAPLEAPARERAEAARPARAKAPTRRPFSEYAAEYRYVLGDLRRIALVAGSLLLVLIVLSFFIR